jgi:hypothetical protein
VTTSQNLVTVQAASSSGSPGLQHEKDDNRNEYWRYDDASNGKSGIRAAIVLHVCDGAAATRILEKCLYGRGSCRSYESRKHSGEWNEPREWFGATVSDMESGRLNLLGGRCQLYSSPTLQ